MPPRAVLIRRAPALHETQLVLSDELLGLGRARQMDRDEVGLHEQRLERRHRVDAHLLGAIGAHVGVERDHAHAEPRRPLRHQRAHTSEAHQPERLAGELDAFHRERSHVPALRAECACGVFRAWASSSAIACSAALMMLDCGAFTTITPRRVAASTSTLSRPMPARATTFRFVAAASTPSVTWVALRMISASYVAISAVRSPLARSVRSSTWKSRPQQIESLRRERLGDEDLRTPGATP